MPILNIFGPDVSWTPKRWNFEGNIFDSILPLENAHMLILAILGLDVSWTPNGGILKGACLIQFFYLKMLILNILGPDVSWTPKEGILKGTLNFGFYFSTDSNMLILNRFGTKWELDPRG